MPASHESLDDLELPSYPPDWDGEEHAHGPDDREHRVAHRPSPLPAREEDEQDLAEADLHRELDFDDESDSFDLDLDDLDDFDRND
jgi:hypothetical protein